MLSESQISRIVEEVMARLKVDVEGESSDLPADASKKPSADLAPPVSAGKKLITEADVSWAVEKGVKKLSAAKGAIVTPLARDLMKEKGISLEIAGSSSDRPFESTSDVIAIGADHGGYELKETIKKALMEEDRNVKDLGTFSSQPVDYPDFAVKVAQAVARGECYTGIMVDGGAFASAIVANKVPGILAAACWDVFTARAAREHVGANVLTLGGKVIGPALALEMVKVWLETPFAGGRHERRVGKIREVEKGYLK